jgi:outer membrane protein assembly factor BamA
MAFLLVMSKPLSAQFVEDTTKKVQYLAVPVFFKTPEFGYAYGLSGSMSFKTSFKKDSLTRTSVIQVIGFNTSRRVNVEAIDAVIYFPKENYILTTQITHNFFPDKFWGIGPNTPDTKRPDRYTYEHFYFFPHIKKRVTNRVFVGLLYEFQDVFRLNYADSGLFATSPFYGKAKYMVSGFGTSVSFDTRNNTFWPEKGMYLLSQITEFNKIFLSNYNVLKWTTDLRVFRKLFKNNILAFQLFNYRTYGQTPIRDLGALGGPNNLRGFYQGRYRANSMFSCIAEYRYNFYKRFSLCMFGGLGTVYTLRTELNFDNLKYSYGGGLRFALLEKEKLNIRLDYGYSNKFNNGFYFTIGECF